MSSTSITVSHFDVAALYDPAAPPTLDQLRRELSRHPDIEWFEWDGIRHHIREPRVVRVVRDVPPDVRITRKSIAELAEVSPRTVSRWLQQHDLTLDDLKELRGRGLALLWQTFALDEDADLDVATLATRAGTSESTIYRRVTESGLSIDELRRRHRMQHGSASGAVEAFLEKSKGESS